MANIGRLSADVLSDIFIQVAIDGYHDVPQSQGFTVPVPAMPRTSSRVYKYIAFSHVCREWRRIALGTPTLWARMVFPCKPPSEELFARSGRAPLWVKTVLEADNNTGVQFSLIKANAPRLRQLHLIGPALAIVDYLLTWTSQADELEDLALLAEDTYGTVRERSPHPQIPSQPPKSLRRLAIRNFALNWASPLLSPTLTTLATSTYGTLAPSAGSMIELLNALRNMSALEFLELSETIPHIPQSAAAAPQDNPAVNLPRLRTCVLKGRVKELAYLLRHLSIPPETRLVLAAHDRGEDVQQLMGAVHEVFARNSWDPIVGLLLPADSMGRMCIMGWRSLVESDPKLPCDLQISLDSSKCFAAIRDIMDGPVFAQCQRAKAERMHADCWEKFLHHLPELRELTMRDTEYMDLPVLSGKPREVNLPVPKLTVLKLSCFRFGCIHDEHRKTGYEQLVSILRWRRKHDVPITRLELLKCTNADEAAVDSLRIFPLLCTYDHEDMAYDFGLDMFDGVSDEDA
ncbi:hypothetical protein L227DRAFT_319032 [Lentinus tigrinus ALCF2SS1-6]|uniref:Uncharacterized protein n=1 Tax=Lentinus tigrinus ALCF2SS1-6 TaxID=1328759 RepID=A0A5C2SRX6_9APHY|nr:hypothetical protein L227DRAFT_319032 [Lentinus tigrinus ALCF2SS1-6]